MDLARGAVIERLMGAILVVEPEVGRQAGLQFVHLTILLDVNVFVLERGIIHLHSASTLSGPDRSVDSVCWSGRTAEFAGRGARSRMPAAGGVARLPRRRPTRST